MKKLKKNNLVVIFKKDFYHKEATDGSIEKKGNKEKKGKKRDRMDICVIKVAMPIIEAFPLLNSTMVDKIKKKFPKVEVNINRDLGNKSALIFSEKARSVCSNGDVYNKETGEKIAYSKAMLKAYTTAFRIEIIILKEIRDCMLHADKITDYFHHLGMNEKKFLSRYSDLYKNISEEDVDGIINDVNKDDVGDTPVTDKQ